MVAPVAGTADDEVAVAATGDAYPGREIITVRAETLFAYGGGGPHCITQQVPAGTFVSA